MITDPATRQFTNPTLDSTICETYGYCAKDLRPPATRRIPAKRGYHGTAGSSRRRT